MHPWDTMNVVVNGDMQYAYLMVVNFVKAGRDCDVGLRSQTSSSFKVEVVPRLMRG